MIRCLERLLALTVLSVLLTGVMATPALAHGRGSDASNFLSTITDHPDVARVEFAIINSDEYLQVTNDSDVEVAIPGYQGEPYLRIGPDGVFRNRSSQATYINEDRFGQTTIPTDIDPDGRPDWEQLSSGNRYAWHDHRIHWMAQTQPPAVQTDPDATHVVTTWTVPFTVGEDAHELAGHLTWIPGGNPWAWLIPALLVVSLPVAYALLRTRPDHEAGEWRGLSTPAGVALLVLAVANVIHLVDDLFATPIPLSQTAVAAIQTAFFIAIAMFGAVRAIQGREGAFTALGVGAGAVFIGQGLLYVSVLSASQTASLFPGALTRAVIALSLAQILPLGIAAVVGTRTLLPEWDDSDLAAEAATPSSQI
ncbi:MAG TPA: hypothetical protein VMM13_01855 [Euzebya sp.]|nr:hypothetical protein [Euzebya sp.]